MKNKEEEEEERELRKGEGGGERETKHQKETKIFFKEEHHLQRKCLIGLAP